MRKYKHLDIWNKSILLVDEIYNLTKYFPKEEMFGLSQQMRRAAVSIPPILRREQEEILKTSLSNFFL